jgi:signal transduction histidine kinase
MKDENKSLLAQEYKVLHEVSQALQSSLEIKEMLKKVLWSITQFEELKVEQKAGIFLADTDKNVLKLYTTVGYFSDEFLEKEKVIPFGDCLCGRVAVSGQLLMSESCFEDSRHERTFSDMTAHGHYIVPLKSQQDLVGVMFLYTNTNPSWYRHSQEVLISIGGLIANAIKRKQIEEELNRHRNHLEELVDSRTSELTQANTRLKIEIDQHKETQVELINSREQLRKLSNQIQAVREEEKSRISREVHDRLGQALTALKMDTSHIEKKLPPDQIDLKERLQSMTSIIDETIKSVQQIAMELRPPILDAFGLCEAIAWEAGEYKKRYGINFDLNCLQDQVNIEKNLKTTFFRIFQEILTNIVRHSKANHVQVSFNLVEDTLILEVEDNGIGINKESINSSNSIGLIGIQERAHCFEGKVEFDGRPGKGTKITVKIPI